MFVILVYDAGVKRVNKFHKICRKYLNWTQLSVFEGELNLAQLERLLSELRNIVNPNEDSIIVYTFHTKKYFLRRILGHNKQDPESRFL